MTDLFAVTDVDGRVGFSRRRQRPKVPDQRVPRYQRNEVAISSARSRPVAVSRR